MKTVIAILMVALISGCGSITTQETGTNCQNTESEVTNMIKNKNYIKVAQVDKNVLEVDNDFISLQDAQDYLDYYLSQGYGLYDIYNGGTSSGFSRLSDAGYTNPKVVCLWVGTMASATYSVQTGYFSGGTAKTSVIILNVCIDSLLSKKVIGNSSGNFVFTFDGATAAPDFTSYGIKIVLFKQTKGLKIDIGGSVTSITGISAYNCFLYGGPAILNFINFELEYCQCDFAYSSPYTIYSWTTNKKVNNVRFKNWNHPGEYPGGSTTFNATAGAAIVFRNCIIDDIQTPMIFPAGQYFDFVNCEVGANITLNSTKTSVTSYLKINGTIVSNSGNYPIVINTDAALKYVYNNKNISYAGPTGDYTRSGSPVKLDIAQLPPTMATFYRQSCLVKVEYRGQSTPFGFEMRQYYKVQFLSKYMFQEELKNWTLNKYWLIKRDDCEVDLLTAQKYIKGLAFYSDSGATTPYTYTNDENLLIRAYNATTGETHIFILYNGALRKTAYSNPQADTIYTVQAVFQIWKPESFTEIENSFATITNAPITGEALFNNMDNEVVR